MLEPAGDVVVGVCFSFFSSCRIRFNSLHTRKRTNAKITTIAPPTTATTRRSTATWSSVVYCSTVVVAAAAAAAATDFTQSSSHAHPACVRASCVRVRRSCVRRKKRASHRPTKHAHINGCIATHSRVIDEAIFFMPAWVEQQKRRIRRR